MAKVRVRVAVAVGPDGKWNATGWSGACDDGEVMSLAIDSVEGGERRYWLEAWLEIPEIPTVEASVTEEKP